MVVVVEDVSLTIIVVVTMLKDLAMKIPLDHNLPLLLTCALHAKNASKLGTLP